MNSIAFSGKPHPAVGESWRLHCAAQSCSVTSANAGKNGEAIELFEETIAQSKAKLGPDHPSTLLSMNSLSVLYSKINEKGKGTELMEEVLQLTRDRYGPDHVQTLTAKSQLAVAYFENDRSDKAVPARI